MSVSTILHVWTFPIVDRDDLHCIWACNTSFLKCLRVGNPFLELFWDTG